MDNCDWWIRATKHSTTDTCQVVKLSEKQTCSHTQLPNENVLCHFLKGILVDSTDSMLWRKQIQRTLNNRLCVHISYWKAWNPKMYDLNLLRGTHEEGFQRQLLYCCNLEKKNLGAVTHIKMSDDNKFEYFFIAIGCAVRALQICLRPIIIIDGTHLKGKYLGTIFLVVGMDGNNQILPIAFGVGKTESGESWIWFLSRLKE
uniref:MULE transposase domain-containing protein n=1 Tax=Lactuca sativa TaxID=4236 RepID=A0A9R1UT60_LACSA|nr:hypothetical protein LSAT_V11C800406530 [Lactuca sativa]